MVPLGVLRMWVRHVVASRVNADVQPSTTLRGGAGPQRQQVPVAAQHPNEVCVSDGVRIKAFNVCSAVEVDKKLGFKRRRSGPIAAAVRRRGALAQRRCSVAWALRRWTGKGDDLGRTHEVTCANCTSGAAT